MAANRNNRPAQARRRSGREPREGAVQIEVGPTERLYQVNDGAPVAGGESHAGKIGASDIFAIRADPPGRKMLLNHHRGLTDNSLQRRCAGALGHDALPVVSNRRSTTML